MNTSAKVTKTGSPARPPTTELRKRAAFAIARCNHAESFGVEITEAMIKKYATKA